MHCHIQLFSFMLCYFPYDLKCYQGLDRWWKIRKKKKEIYRGWYIIFFFIFFFAVSDSSKLIIIVVLCVIIPEIIIAIILGVVLYIRRKRAKKRAMEAAAAEGELKFFNFSHVVSVTWNYHAMMVRSCVGGQLLYFLKYEAQWGSASFYSRNYTLFLHFAIVITSRWRKVLNCIRIPSLLLLLHNYHSVCKLFCCFTK